MESFFKIFLIIHIAGGTIGLLAGTYIMFAKKGDKLHKRVGKLFAFSMLGAGFSSLILAKLHHINFLFAVGVFTIYMTGTGWRYLYLKNIAKGQKPILIDWILMAFMIFGGIWFIKMGVVSIIDKEYFGAIILIFAWRGLSFVYYDFQTYNGKIEAKNYWLLFHLQRMIGSYIASMTAFIVVNSPDRLSFIPWILPAIIIVPLIIKWSKKYKVSLEK